MTRIFLPLSVLVLALAPSAFGLESRSHFAVAKRNRQQVYEVTRIYKHDAAGSTVHSFLIADSAGPLVIIETIRVMADRQTVYSFRMMRGAKAEGRIVEELPVVSTTPEARAKELQRPDVLATPVPVSVHGNGKTFRGREADWDESSAVARVRSRETLGKDLVQTLSGLRELAGLPMFAELNASLRYLFEDESLVRRSKTLMVATTDANCKFDAKFGLPCKN